MEVLPENIKLVELSPKEKILARWSENSSDYGYLLLNCNPAMIPNDVLQILHIIVMEEGVLFLKVLPDVTSEDEFLQAIRFLRETLWPKTANLLKMKLKSNKAICDGENLLFSTNFVVAFPELNISDILLKASFEDKRFIQECCLFQDDYESFQNDFGRVVRSFLNYPMLPVAPNPLHINDGNVNSILQRLTPEYEIIRTAPVVDGKMTYGVGEELLVVDECNKAVRAFRLDKDQINIVNKIRKGEQLILACAGSGKSILLIAKCFKAAEMNPDKNFLLVCKSNKLRALYDWYIDHAGLKGKNVECSTFHSLCKELIVEAGYPLQNDADPNTRFRHWVTDAIRLLNSGRIQKRFYGIFIDEVQMFEKEWYKFTFNLLENRDSEEHIFVICGDKTQNISKEVKNGDAPWQLGDPYPKYRGKKSMRIEKNYRNSIEINDFINKYSIQSKEYLTEIQPDVLLDSDLFLRGQSLFHGEDVLVKKMTLKGNAQEAMEVIDSIKVIHNQYKIPYDEIAVDMFNGTYHARIGDWGQSYNLEKALYGMLNDNNIPFCRFYSDGFDYGESSPEAPGVRLIKFESSMGLDFRAVIVCGLLPLGYRVGSKEPGALEKEDDQVKRNELIQDSTKCINYLYVACTRAKEILHIILPETGDKSVYARLIEEAYES